MVRTIEICQNCDKEIGSLKRACVYEDNVVCGDCYTKLKPDALAVIAKPVQTEQMNNPVPINCPMRMNCMMPMAYMMPMAMNYPTCTDFSICKVCPVKETCPIWISHLARIGLIKKQIKDAGNVVGGIILSFILFIGIIILALIWFASLSE